MEMKEVHQVEDALSVIRHAFERYRFDEQPSSALNETVQSIQMERRNGMKLYGIWEQNEWLGVVKYVSRHDLMYFSRLSVLPDHQGKGVATSLIRFIERQAIREGLSRSQCSVRKRETKNICLYAKLGYAVVDESRVLNANGHEIETLTMEKQLVE